MSLTCLHTVDRSPCVLTSSEKSSKSRQLCDVLLHRTAPACAPQPDDGSRLACEAASTSSLVPRGRARAILCYSVFCSSVKAPPTISTCSSPGWCHASCSFCSVKNLLTSDAASCPSRHEGLACPQVRATVVGRQLRFYPIYPPHRPDFAALRQVRVGPLSLLDLNLTVLRLGIELCLNFISKSSSPSSWRCKPASGPSIPQRAKEPLQPGRHWLGVCVARWR